MSFSSTSENSFDEVPMPIVGGRVEGPPSLPVSRSTSSSSFTRHSWTELKADTNISDEEYADQWGRVGHGQSLRQMEFSDNDSTFGTFGCEIDGTTTDALKRNFAKMALFGIIVAMIFGKSVYPWGDITKINEMSEENATKLRTELDKMMAEKWEFELKLVKLREELETERNCRKEAEKTLRKAHEQLEIDLNDRIRLETELGKTRAELVETEEKVAEAEREADGKWMSGGGMGQLNRAYRKVKRAQLAHGKLRETSEWWVPLYWRVARVTLFNER
ncbi:hypothetical protein niasHS_003592 [Heterodera schachtii]|uniref:Uncharacterized protein n=1 Tax=Heterodera schachtii TaxID=97005 RepID=A0ABD2KGY8_HETSC